MTFIKSLDIGNVQVTYTGICFLWQLLNRQRYSTIQEHELGTGTWKWKTHGGLY